MNLRNKAVRMGFAMCLAAAGGHAVGGPLRCSAGNQDSTCAPHVSSAWQTPPTCPAQPGWTTVASAAWIGSQYSAPQCNYQAPPSCPAGYSTVSAASWNGSSWVGLGCAIPPPPTQGVCQYGFASGPAWTGSSWSYTCNAPPPVVDLKTSCEAALPSAISSGAVTSITTYEGDSTDAVGMQGYRAQYPGDRLLSWTAFGSNGCDNGGQVARGAVMCAINPNTGHVDAIIASIPQSACHPH